MTHDERDILLIETSTNVKWLKENAEAHRQQHNNYMYCLFATFFAAIVGWFRGG